MGIFGTEGGRSGEEIAQRQAIITSIATETDPLKLAKYIAFDQVNYCYDPCGKSWHELDPALSDMSRKAVKRLAFLFSGQRDILG